MSRRWSLVVSCACRVAGGYLLADLVEGGPQHPMVGRAKVDPRREVERVRQPGAVDVGDGQQGLVEVAQVDVVPDVAQRQAVALVRWRHLGEELLGEPVVLLAVVVDRLLWCC